MTTVVGVRFKKAGKIYYFDPDQIDIKIDDAVIVETARGIEFGLVVVGPKEIKEEDMATALKKVIRLADADDIETQEKNKAKEEEAFNICLEKIEKHKLDMKLIEVEYTFDNNKVIFYFTSDGRVDFRELVKDLASVFKTRIELRQIGVRDEAKMIGGLGPCGRTLCCGTFLGEFEPVSIKMAKEQDLSLNPTKISGICGRLMCCLKYEHETYEDILDRLPQIGSRVKTSRGVGIVVDTVTLLELAKVRVKAEDGTEEIVPFAISEIEEIDKKSKKKRHSYDNFNDIRKILEKEDIDDEERKELEKILRER